MPYCFRAGIRSGDDATYEYGYVGHAFCVQEIHSLGAMVLWAPGELWTALIHRRLPGRGGGDHFSCFGGSVVEMTPSGVTRGRRAMIFLRHGRGPRASLAISTRIPFFVWHRLSPRSFL